MQAVMELRQVQYPKEDEGPRMLVVTSTITILALLTIIVRLFVRIKMIRNVGWDVSFISSCDHRFLTDDTRITPCASPCYS